MIDILIQNGRVIDPANHLDAVADVLIRNGKIDQVGQIKGSGQNVKIIDAANQLVVPGLIDMHVHLREPGDEEEETIASGSAAAVAGGFTSVVCMPNTDPPIDNEATVDFIYRQAAKTGICNVFPAGAITKGRAGKEMAELGQMIRAGVVAFSDDGNGVQDTSVMQRALKYASMFDKPICQHCQVDSLAGHWCMNAGYHATVLGLPGMNRLAEELMLNRDIQLTKQAGNRYHAQHVSTAGSVDLIRQAKDRRWKVTCEVTPHHILLTDESCTTYDTNYKMSPPLRTEKDVQALLQGVKDGTIDCLVSDHAPHLQSEKELEFLAAPCGIISLECALGLYVKALIEPGIIDWPRLIEMMSANPARILGIDKGTITVGADADVTIIDPKRDWFVDMNTFRSKSRNCPYHKWELTARATCTIVGGTIQYQI